MSETVPAPLSRTTLGLIERIREPSFMFSLVSIALAADIILSGRYNMNLLDLRWPLPDSILLGHVATFVAGYALVRSLLLPVAIWVMDKALYAADDVWAHLSGNSLMFPTTRALPDQHVFVWMLHRPICGVDEFRYKCR